VERVLLQVDDGGGVATEERTFDELGLRIDLETVGATARAVGHEGSVVERVRDALRARAGLIDVPLIFSLDAGRLLAVLSGLKETTDEPPVAAKLDFAKDQATPEQPGHYLDVDAAVAAILRSAASGERRVILRRTTVPPRITRALLEGIDRRRVVSAFSTYFSRAGSQATRAHNIETAASKLDGVVLFPHEIVSFNRWVGPRSVENGFAKSWEIFKGEMIEGTGGGTCQVATTFYAAAYFAGLDVLERFPHSRPSAYITMGLDATVVYPVVDLKLRNPFDFPLVVHGAVDGNRVTFEVYGRDQPAFVRFDREVVKTRPFARKVEEKAGVPMAKAIRKQHGIRGYTVRRTRTLDFRDGHRAVERNTDVYPPTAEVYVVAPGADADSILPPLVDPTEANTTALAQAVAPSPSSDGAAPAGTAAFAETNAAIIDAPGLHRPTSEQADAKAKVVMTTHVR
jgi:vancomycin resistance protein YoaR